MERFSLNTGLSVNQRQELSIQPRMLQAIEVLLGVIKRSKSATMHGLDEELRSGLSQSNNMDYLFEFVNPILEWCEAEDEKTCNDIMKKCEFEYETFPGEFIKAILKINNMVKKKVKKFFMIAFEARWVSAFLR